MKYKKYFIDKVILIIAAVLVSSSFTGCQNILNSDYQKDLEYFNNEFTTHFPKIKIDNYRYELILDTFAYHNTESLLIYFNDNPKMIKKVLKKLKNKEVYSISDTNLIVVNDFITYDNLDNKIDGKKTKYTEFGKTNKLILPNFWNFSKADIKTKSRLPNTFEFIIIETEIGLFSKNIDPKNTTMPNGIEHGMSRGVAIDKTNNDIFFWVILW